jgi:nitroimidazol reductase NimA-like FMN-containing flavoprotein (pyridoxamine 5'-phosphate oxidase superfamily)
MCTDQGPQILPVNYTLVDDAIMFRTHLYSALAAGTTQGTVAFEVDELDDRLEFGWSVLAIGRAEHVQGEDMIEIFRALREPWAPGSRPLVARIVPDVITGRRFERAR